MERKTFLTVAAGAVVSGCSKRTVAAHFDAITSNDEPLRSAFNRDAGKVRIVMLVSPT